MGEIGVEIACPFVGSIAANGEAVNSVKGLEVVEVRSEGVWSKCAEKADVDLSGVSKEASFAHESQEAECMAGLFITDPHGN